MIETIWSAVGPRTKVLYISHHTSSTALTLPVAELCRRARERGIRTVVDGAHVPGHLPLDLRGLDPDYYAGNCHKWLFQYCEISSNASASDANDDDLAEGIAVNLERVTARLPKERG